MFRTGLQTFLTVALARATTVVPKLSDRIYIKTINSFFIWDDASTLSDDGLLVIKQANVATGRFINEAVQNKQISTNYTVVASDFKTILWAIGDNTTLTFNTDGMYNLSVRAYPVMVVSPNSSAEILDAGDYLICVLTGIITVK